jgi:hypothetical protein
MLLRRFNVVFVGFVVFGFNKLTMHPKIKKSNYSLALLLKASIAWLPNLKVNEIKKIKPRKISRAIARTYNACPARPGLKSSRGIVR